MILITYVCPNCLKADMLGDNQTCTRCRMTIVEYAIVEEVVR